MRSATPVLGFGDNIVLSPLIDDAAVEDVLDNAGGEDVKGDPFGAPAQSHGSDAATRQTPVIQPSPSFRRGNRQYIFDFPRQNRQAFHGFQSVCHGGAASFELLLVFLWKSKNKRHAFDI